MGASASAGRRQDGGRDLHIGSLPICGEDIRLKGMQADVARSLPSDRVGDLVEYISE